MKIRIWEMIVFSVLAVFAIAFSLLQKTWDGFTYFSTATFLLFMGFFINNRIYYIRYLKKQYDEGLETYFVELYNNGLISREQFDEVDPRIVKGYYKDYRRSRSLTILLIIGFALIIVSLILTVFNVWW